MNFRRLATHVAAFVLLAATGTVQAETVTVHCGAGYGLSTITAALNLLKNAENPVPSTINVQGNCAENIVIKDVVQLTIAAHNGASITEASNGMRDVIAVDNSRVAITGLTVNGNANTDGIDCYNGSYCALNGLTVTGSADGGDSSSTTAGICRPAGTCRPARTARRP